MFDAFRGNTNLKRSGQPINWTSELVLQYKKCSEDVIYFGENYFTIVTENGKEKIGIRDYQNELINSCVNNRFTIAEMSRQCGKTTAVTVFALWYIIFNPDKTIALLANKGETAREILGRIQMAYELLPQWLQHGVKEWNKGSFVLENGSRIIAAATSASAIRGYAIDVLILDEAAHIDNWNEFYTSVYPTISSRKKSKIIMISTVYGLNHFYQFAQNARKGVNNFYIISIPWQKVPGRDEHWKEETLASMNYDYEKFAQEYENEYLGSSGTLIAGWKLKDLTLINVEPLLDSAGIKQYSKPIPRRDYALIADTSRGKGLDHSAFHIIDITEMPYEQVCVYRDNLISPIDYSEVIHRMAKLYNSAIVLIENNDIGAQVADHMYYDYEYENILSTQNAGNKGKMLSSGFAGKGKAERGIRTTTSVKAIGCSLIKMLIEQDKLILVDKETVNELSTFSKKGKSYEAETGKNDDLVMGLVLFGWLTNQTYFKELTDINTLSELRERDEEQMMADLMPFGVIEDHNVMDESYSSRGNQEGIFDHYALDFDKFDEGF